MPVRRLGDMVPLVTTPGDFATAGQVTRAPIPDIYAAIAQFYGHIADDFEADRKDVAALESFLKKPAK